MSKKSLHIKVTGRVQGVHYRGTIRNYASILGLTGFARNLPDGAVEISAQGEESTLTSFLRLVQHGSLLSKVTGLEYQWGQPHKNDATFSVLRNGNLIQDQVQSLSNLGKNIIFPKGTVIPAHIAIIPDGNRRWAKERGLPSLKGHEEGLNRIEGLSQATREAQDNEIRFRHLGRKDRLPEKLVEKLAGLEKATSGYGKYFLNLALDYGGRDEILRGVKKIIDEKISPKALTDTIFSGHLDTAGITDPDLIIRTSGEQRTSGLLPWQGTYSELYFAPVHFPDFDASQLRLALLEYSQRQRRFGH